MTYIVDRPDSFREQLIAGFVGAYRGFVERVPGASGVAVAGGAVRGRVSVVIGGGAGHYPASMGLVGAGMATAAVVGEVFTSPSAEQVYRVARAVDAGAGVLFAFGNYAGDVLNFNAAADRLRAEGTPVEIVLGTDDVASAAPDQREKRRGVGGALFVYKAAGAAASGGLPLPEVTRLAAHANGHTRTLGVAWRGCTLPGSAEPLFGVSPGVMEVGLGIHGEPGVDSVAVVPAGELARLLWQPLLAEQPKGHTGRVALVLNGLGATKCEEMFVLWGHIATLARSEGLEVVWPEVGEYMTSLDMAGCSLSLTWLDKELERLWVAPAHSPGFRRGDVSTPDQNENRVPLTAAPPRCSGSDTAEPDEYVGITRQSLTRMLDAMVSHEAELGRVDAVAGDGDHGSGMVRGLRAAVRAADLAEGGTSDVLAAAGRAWGDEAGGTSGALWSTLLQGVAAELGERPISSEVVAAAIAEGLAAVQSAGGAEVGDKTMVDALAPFVGTLSSRVQKGEPLPTAWRAAARTSMEAAEATAPLRPRLGRARPLAERSIGTPDPGALSLAMCLDAVASALEEHFSQSA